MSKKNRNVAKEAAETNEKNLPAKQDNSTNGDPKKEEKNMDLKEVKKNVYQKVGEALTKHGDKKAAYAAEHPTADKVKKVIGATLGIGAVIGTVVGGVVHHNKKKDEEIDYYSDVDKYDDFDDETEVEDLDNAVETETEVDDAEETATEE